MTSENLREDARVIGLFWGLALLGTAALVLACAPNYACLMAGSMLAGCGNAVFHPADYTLLNQRVSGPRLAHAFSVHGVSGNLGWAAAPVFLAAVAALSSWRGALVAAAAIPFGVLCLLFLNRAVLRVEARPARSGAVAGEGGSLGFLRLRPGTPPAACSGSSIRAWTAGLRSARCCSAP